MALFDFHAGQAHPFIMITPVAYQRFRNHSGQLAARD